MDQRRDRLVSLYDDYLRAVNDRRFEDLALLVADDVRGSAIGREAYVTGLRAMLTAFPDYRWQVDRLVAEGDQLAVLLTGTGTHIGSFGPIAPTGRTVTVQDMAFYRVVDDQIVEAYGDLGSVILEALSSTDHG